jgi:Zn-dependent M28 family amino/carboxypeptidase
MMRTLLLAFWLGCTLTACARENSAPVAGPAAAPTAASAAPAIAPTSPENPAPGTPVRAVDGARAIRYVKDIVAFGPRYLGSPGHKKFEDYLRSRLKADVVEEDAFTLDSPEGKFPGRNFIARFPGAKDGAIVIAGHYDTNYPLRNIAYVGANDGGSSAAILLELANHLRGKKLAGYSVWLVWLDAEEAMRTWSDTDSVYGSRHLAEKWKQDGTLPKIKAFILADMIGDADLNIDRVTNSTPWLSNLVYKAASNLAYQSYFFQRDMGAVGDDHVPFVERGVPAVDLIDFNYGYNDVFHHTIDDTVDKLSPRSMQIVGDVMLETVRLVNARQ